MGKKERHRSGGECSKGRNVVHRKACLEAPVKIGPAGGNTGGPMWPEEKGKVTQ